MTQRTILEATALVGAALLVLGAGLAAALAPWFLGLIAGGILAMGGFAAIARSVLRLRRHDNLDAAVPGPPAVVIAALAGLLAAAVAVVTHLKVGIFSSSAGVTVLIAAALVVVTAVFLAVRWSR